METIISKPYAERMAILGQLFHQGWNEVVRVESSKTTYYLFESLDKTMTIGLNTGEDDFYNDVVMNEY